MRTLSLLALITILSGCPFVHRVPAGGWTRVEGGYFLMGSQEAATGGIDFKTHPRKPDERVHLVGLTGFQIMRSKVTIAEYEKCMRARKCHSVPLSTPGTAPMKANWAHAWGYCSRWLGGNLPTEAQWEYTAKGRTARQYPWGNKIRGLACAGPHGVCGLTTAPGEWVEDFYALYPRAVVDPTGPTRGVKKVVRGGRAWRGAAVRTAARSAAPWKDRRAFRCVKKDPQGMLPNKLRDGQVVAINVSCPELQPFVQLYEGSKYLGFTPRKLVRMRNSEPLKLRFGSLKRSAGVTVLTTRTNTVQVRCIPPFGDGRAQSKWRVTYN